MRRYVVIAETIRARSVVAFRITLVSAAIWRRLLALDDIVGGVVGYLFDDVVSAPA